MSEVLPPAAQLPTLNPQLMGVRVPRVEDPRLLTGRGRFMNDITLPGMLHAAFLRSTLANGKIVAVDAAQARALPGVHAVLTGADIAPLSPGLIAGNRLEGMRATTQPLIAAEYVRHVGEAVAVVVADSRRVAEDGAALIDVDIEPLPAVIEAEAAATGAEVANLDVPDNVTREEKHASGDADAAFAAAAVVVSGRFQTARAAALPMETRGCIADYDWTTGQLRLWSSTQVPHTCRLTVSAFLGIPEHQVEVIVPDVGGGFGQKCVVFPEELVLPLLAREVNRPVKWIEDRVENLATGTHGKGQVNELELALDEDGRILGLRQDVIGDAGAYNCYPWTALVEAKCATGAVTGVYDIPNIKTRLQAVLTNKVPIGPYRGVGWTAPQIARECLLDLAARKLNLSPFEVRKRNVVKPDQFPYVAATGARFSEGSYLESIEALEGAIDLQAFRARQEQERQRGRYLGLGISIFNEMTGTGTVASQVMGFGTTSHDTSTVRMEPTGKVTVFTSLTSQGQGHQTTFAQLTGDALGVPVEDVVVRAADTRQTWGLGTWSSRAAVIGGGSILRAAQPIRQKLLSTASHVLEAAEEDLVLANGRVEVKGAPGAGLSVAEVAGIIYFAGAVRPPDMDPTLESTATYDPAGEVWANGAHMAIVDVDPETGLVKIERYVVVEDCGPMINPMIVEGQLRGGIAQAIGAALLEEIVYDDQGQLLTSTLMDYLVPTASEVPSIEMIHLETPSQVTAGGIKGMGESAMIAAPAAILNAVNDAIEPFGTHLTDLPVTPDRIVAATT